MPKNKQETVENSVFDTKQMNKIMSFVEKKDKVGLEKYLMSIASYLNEKGVDPKYIYYNLCYNFNLG